LYANYTWYNFTGGSWNAKFKGRVSVLNNTVYHLNLSAANTTKSDKWNCSVLPYDGTAYGSWDSDNTTIQNWPARISTGPTITPTDPNRNNNLSCSFTFEDLDAGDTLQNSRDRYRSTTTQSTI
jgi:hypothetical protein